MNHTQNPFEGQKCGYCKTLVVPPDVHCDECGYPQFGGKNAKLAFIAELNEKKNQYEKVLLELGRIQFYFNLVGIICAIVAIASWIQQEYTLNFNIGMVFFGVLLIAPSILHYFRLLRPFVAILAPTLLIFLTTLAIACILILKVGLILEGFPEILIGGGFLSFFGFYFSYRVFQNEKLEMIIFKNPMVRKKFEASFQKKKEQDTAKIPLRYR